MANYLLSLQQVIIFLLLEGVASLGAVAHACNPSYSGG